jgi:hypothetical protein
MPFGIDNACRYTLTKTLLLIGAELNNKGGHIGIHLTRGITSLIDVEFASAQNSFPDTGFHCCSYSKLIFIYFSLLCFFPAA